MGANDPLGVANLDPRGMIGMIYVGYHLALLHTLYAGFRPCAFREEYYSRFPIISLWQIMTPLGVTSLDPRGMVDRIYKEDC